MATTSISSFSFLLVSLLFSATVAVVDHRFLKRVDHLHPNTLKLREKMSHIHFYFHDKVSNPNATAVRIVNPPDPSIPNFFGFIAMMDDKLTEGPEKTSREIGRAQGFYASACQGELGFLQAMNLVFSSGKYNGSVITVLGRNAPLHDVREMPVVGGAGLFRFARGYAQAHTHWVDFKTGDAVVEYNVYVTHY